MALVLMPTHVPETQNQKQNPEFVFDTIFQTDIAQGLINVFPKTQNFAITFLGGTTYVGIYNEASDAKDNDHASHLFEWLSNGKYSPMMYAWFRGTMVVMNTDPNGSLKPITYEEAQVMMTACRCFAYSGSFNISTGFQAMPCKHLHSMMDVTQPIPQVDSPTALYGTNQYSGFDNTMPPVEEKIMWASTS